MGRLLLVVASLAAVALGAPAAAFACHPEGIFAESDTRVRMDDGVDIAVTVYTDQPSGCPHELHPRPAVMLFHGLGGTRADMNPIAEEIFARRGYVVLTFDARAHGASGGLFNVDGPREIEDVRRLFEWLGARPDVDESHIGALGFSYGGGAILGATVDGVPFAAIAPAITWTDLYQALAPQNLAKSGVIFQLSRLVPSERYAPEARVLLADLLANRNHPAIRAYAEARSTRSALGGVRTPTLILHGRRDFLFDLDQALAAFRRLAGPKRLYIGQLGHAPAANPAAEREHYLGLARAWFDRFLQGMPNAAETQPPIEIARDPWNGKVATFRQLPTTRTLRFTLRGVTTIGATGKVARTTARLRRFQETFGAPAVRATLTPRSGWTHFVAVLSALTRTGETVVSEGGTVVRPGSRTVSFRLMNEVTAIPAGSRLHVTIAATSTAQSPGNLLYLVGVPQQARLRVGTIRLSVPVLRSPVSQ